MNIRLTDEERQWIALAIWDASTEHAGDAARLIEARVETLIRRRLEPLEELLQRLEAWDGTWPHPDSSSAEERNRLRTLLERMTDHDPRRQKPDAEIETEPVVSEEHA